MSEKSTNQLSLEEQEELSRKQSLTLRIAREAVAFFNLPNSQPDTETSKNLRWSLWQSESNENVVLSIQLNEPISNAIVHTSLNHVTFHLLSETENLLKNPRAMQLLAVDQSERESVVYEKTLALLKDYIDHLPAVIYHSFYQALRESIISHFKKFVESDLKKYWQSIGEEREVNILPDGNLGNLIEMFPETELPILEHLEQVNEELSAYRKTAFSNRQVWLNQEAFNNLPANYEQLRAQYKIVKKEYRLERDAYFRINRRATRDDWQAHWKETCDETFPNLFLTEEIESYSASELAYKQLAEVYDFSPNYMERIVVNARKKLKNEFNKQMTDIETKIIPQTD